MIDYEKLTTSTGAALRTPSELGVCLVTGAAGFVGARLVRALLDHGLTVRALINRTALPLAHPRLTLVPASVSDRAALDAACAGVDTVFHAAAKIALLGGPFVRAAYRDAAVEVNVRGTRNLLDAAQAAGARRFVYTSSVDVCFEPGHQPEMREDAPYSRGRSVYQQTKIEAEAMVLARDGVGGMHTCALRPGGIYGPEPNKVIDSFVEQVVRGALLARLGDGSALLDVSHVDSLVHAELLAAMHLGARPDGAPGAADGQAFFINDGEPINIFEFFAPLADALEHPMPTRRLPPGLVLPFLHLVESVVNLVGAAEPTMVPHGVHKVVYTHWSSIEKARRALGYAPLFTVAEGVAQCVPYARSRAAELRARRR